MQEINTVADLQAAIAQLEEKHAEQGKELKAHFHRTFESLKPVPLMESAIHGIVTSSKIREDALTGSISLVAGYIARQVIGGKSAGPVRNILGTVAELGVANVIAQHPRVIKTGFKILKALLGGGGAKAKPKQDFTAK